jgi:hypothetical protein
MFIVVTLAPCCLMAQNFDALGKSRDEVRRLSNSLLNYTTKAESDTCDSYSLLGGMKTRFFYKDGVCSKIENVFQLSYADSFKAMLNHEGIKIGENKWTIQDGTIKVELIADKNQNECILDNTAVDKKTP